MEPCPRHYLSFLFIPNAYFIPYKRREIIYVFILHVKQCLISSINLCNYSGTSVHERLSSRTNFPKKKSQVTNGVSSNEHASRQQRLATSWKYRRESVICCVTFAQYTSLLEFAVPSFEFHCVLWFFVYY
jgi:hypothetical protein